MNSIASKEMNPRSGIKTKEIDHLMETPKKS